MTEKENTILNEIINFYHNNKLMPSIRYLKEKLGYRSTNSIYQFLKKLEQKKYLIRNNSNKLVLNNNYDLFNSGFKIIKVINTNKDICVLLNKNKEYLAYQVKDNNIENFHIIKGDILIIEKTKKIQNNNLGLFWFGNNYRIFKYFYKDGFYILEDNNKLILNQVNIIGIVIKIERKI